MKVELQKWEWLYGHSPKFNVKRSFTRQLDGASVDISIAIDVERGRIENACIDAIGHSEPADWVAQLCREIGDSLQGIRFWRSDLVDWFERPTNIAGDVKTEVFWRSVNDCLCLLVCSS